MSTDSSYCYTPIGLVHSQHVESKKTPIQPTFAEDCVGRIELRKDLAAGLEGIEGFSHLIVLYALHRISKVELTVTPYMGDTQLGVFATRYPKRPNAIGLSILRLIRREGATLHVGEVDILDGTPVLDIKPYVPRFDLRPDASGGWTDTVPEDLARKRGRRAMDAGDAE